MREDATYDPTQVGGRWVAIPATIRRLLTLPTAW